MDNILQFIRQENPDVIALQEVYNGHDPSWERRFRSMDILRVELQYPYEHFAPAFLERTEFGKVEQGNAVFSKFPIIDSQIIVGDVPFGEREDTIEFWERTPRNLQRVAIEFPSRTIQVFNTQGVWGMDGEDNSRRLAMSESIVKEVIKYRDVILAGDFNVKEQTQSIHLIEKHLKNIFKGERSTSFNLLHKTHPGFANAVVDFIFVSPSLSVVEKQSCDENVSDHLAMTAIIDL